MAARAASRYARSSFPPRLEYSSLAVARLNVTFLHVSTFSTVAAIRKRLTGNSSRTAAVYYSNRGGGNWRSFPNVYNNFGWKYNSSRISSRILFIEKIELPRVENFRGERNSNRGNSGFEYFREKNINRGMEEEELRG